MFKNSEKRCQFNDPVVGWSNPLNAITFEKSTLRQRRSSFTNTDDILRLEFVQAFNQNNTDEYNFHLRACLKGNVTFSRIAFIIASIIREFRVARLYSV